MASTRNNNTKGDYCLQQRNSVLNRNYILFEHSQYGMPYQAAFTDAGFAPPSRMWRNQLANNPVEIESALFGINSTNLVNNPKTVVPQLNKLPFISFYDRPQLIMPNSLVVEKDQRVFPLP